MSHSISYSIQYIIQSEGLMSSIEIDSNQTIKYLKKRIKSLYQIPEYCQKIYSNETELLDDKELRNCCLIGLIIYDLNNLRLNIDIKDSRFEFFLKGSESISVLKQKISNKVNIPIQRMKIYNSDKIIEDNQLLEDYTKFIF